MIKKICLIVVLSMLAGFTLKETISSNARNIISIIVCALTVILTIMSIIKIVKQPNDPSNS